MKDLGKIFKQITKRKTLTLLLFMIVMVFLLLTQQIASMKQEIKGMKQEMDEYVPYRDLVEFTDRIFYIKEHGTQDERLNDNTFQKIIDNELDNENEIDIDNENELDNEIDIDNENSIDDNEQLVQN